MPDHTFKPKSLEEILAPESRKARQPVQWRGRAGENKPLWAILGDEPPIGWQLEQEALARRQSSVAPLQLAQVADTNETYGPPAPALVPMDVPGKGRVYFDSEVAANVQDFIDRTGQAGMDVPFTSGFRSTTKQAGLPNDPNATTPASAGNSLHEAGRAFDIQLKNGENSIYSNDQLQQIVDHARQAGFDWGGNFRNPGPDPGHFYIEVPEGIGNRKSRIQRAQEYYRQWLNPK